MTGVTMAVRRGVALLLCPALVLQACATVSPAPEGAVLGRSLIEGGIELKADPDTAQHSANAQNVVRMREGRIIVIPLILVIGNVDVSQVVEVHSAAITLELNDGRILRAIKTNREDEPLPAPNAPAPESQPAAPETSPAPPETPPAETPKTPPPSGGGAPRMDNAGRILSFLGILPSPIWGAIVLTVVARLELDRAPEIGHDADLVLVGIQNDPNEALLFGIFMILVIVTAPIWYPIVLIKEHYEKKAEAQKRRNDALERLEDVRLEKGEVAGGVLYFGVEGDVPATLATATLVVPVRYAGTGEERSVGLPLGKEN